MNEITFQLYLGFLNMFLIFLFITTSKPRFHYNASISVSFRFMVAFACANKSVMLTFTASENQA